MSARLGTAKAVATYDFVRVHDGLQTVGNRQQSDVLPKLGPKRLLDDRVRLIVYSRLVSNTISSRHRAHQWRRLPHPG